MIICAATVFAAAGAGAEEIGRKTLDKSTVYAADELEQKFGNPPESTKPRCYWYWLDGYHSKEGLTKDLEAMREIGIGGAYIGLITYMSRLPINTEPAAFSDEWWSYLEHAVREGGRLGVDIGLFNCPGWSMSGGPWVKSSDAMRYLTQTEMRLRGPQTFSDKLPAPAGEFQDVAVLAFPVPKGEGQQARITARSPTLIQLETAEPFTARSLTVHPTNKRAFRIPMELQASDDGEQYRTITSFQFHRVNFIKEVGPIPLAPVTVAFEPTTARFFRLVLGREAELGEIELSAATRVEDFAGKALLKMYQETMPPFDFYTWPEQTEVEDSKLTINPENVRNLSSKLAEDGTLTWDVPPGEWLVLRVGMSPTGQKNAPAARELTGLEVDKMNEEALRRHLQAYVGELLRRLPPEQREAFKFIIADSYERGPQNWTDGFAEIFRERYGYDPLPYLPAIYGRVVGTAEKSNRFLWDLRRLVADRIATEYVGGMREWAHEQGLRVWLEPFGHWGFPGEFLQYGGQSDLVGAEFWIDDGQNKGKVEVPAAVSVAHTYGKPVVWAEAFTSPRQAFDHTPRDFKKLGDWAYANGINQYVLHVNIHQPWEDRVPGMNMSAGQAFNRHNTWFGMAKSWIDYQRRCSVLLQHGVHVADVAYFIGEDAPKMAGAQNPPLPAGYASDYINAEVLLTWAKVKDQRLVLPDGKAYRLLVLPPSDSMRPEVLERIVAFVDAGLPVFGPLPSRSPSLENYPAADERVRELAAKLDGRVLSGKDLTQALTAPPDVAGLKPREILFNHRQSADTDIYFLSNQTDKPQSLVPIFRVNRPVVEFWYPDLGKIQSVRAETAADAMRVPVNLEPHDSVFVVFRDKPTRGAVKSVPEKATDLQLVKEITGPWTVEFGTNWSDPSDWSDLSDLSDRARESTRYFSGIATYRKSFDIPATPKLAPEAALILDLGQVEEIAEVTVNGKTFPELWKPPYRVDITDALKPGENVLEVRVANTWWNRLLAAKRGIEGIPGPEPWVSNFKDNLFERYLNAEKELLPGGLIGPVRVMHAEDH